MMTNYYYGHPEKEGSYESLLSVFSAHESLNSAQTSSLPLVQFWRDDADLDRRVSAIVREISGLDIGAAEKRFEYATSLPPKSGRGKASMTDLMILSDCWRVAIEAKYTEYTKDPAYRPTVDEWMHERRDDKYVKNREKVLNGWHSLIGSHCGTIPHSVPYQFIHRVASACCCEGKQRPALVYHLFYDDDRSAADAFSNRLKGWAEDIGLRDIRFVVAKTRVVPPVDVPKDLSELFVQMNSERPYGDMAKTEVDVII